jgi:hypothetical protein
MRVSVQLSSAAALVFMSLQSAIRSLHVSPSSGVIRFSTTLNRGRMLFNMKSDEVVVMNKYSRVITESPIQGASQAMLYATGLTPETISLPQVPSCFILYS